MKHYSAQPNATAFSKSYGARILPPPLHVYTFQNTAQIRVIIHKTTRTARAIAGPGPQPALCVRENTEIVVVRLQLAAPEIHFSIHSLRPLCAPSTSKWL